MEYFLSADRTRPAEAAVFSLLMYAFTGAGRCYSWDEIEAWLTKAGFGRYRRHKVTGSIGTLEATRL